MVSTDGIARRRRVTLAVIAIAVFGLVARLAFLGDRIAHWDEARVAYWILHYADTGQFEYQPIIHGPFLQQVNRMVFSVLGPNDFTMRLVVAVLGATLPLAALLFRERLRGAETVALALFFAFDPILLYYSRFMRSDVPLAVFMVFALGFFVRALDTHRRRYVHAGIIAVALGFTTKENVLIYLVTWLGALFLLADHRLFRNRGLGGEWRAALGERAKRVGPTLRTWTPHLLIGIGEFLVVIVYFYAPRTGANSGPGFDDLLGTPTALPAVMREATLGSWNSFTSLWVHGSHHDHSYLPYLGDSLETLAVGSGALVALAVVGFLADRYSGERPRDIVAFSFYWGFVSVLGYPIVSDIAAPWVVVHAVVALAIPAAVGAGVLYRRGRTALTADNRIALGAVVVIALLVVGQVGFVAAEDVYMKPQSDDNPLVQYAQPAGDLRPTIRDMAALSVMNPGTDVLLYGDFLVANTTGSREPACSEWFNFLPLPWYTDAHDMTVACARTPTAFEATVNRSHPPIVIGLTTDSEFFAAHLSGYDERTFLLRTQDTAETNTTFFIDASRLPGNATAQGNS